MYINNVGSIVQALFAAVGEGWRRFAVGFLADHLSHTHTVPRTSCLMLSATIGIVATSILLNVTDVNRLWVVSALWGVSYGTVFALFPALVLERFGIEHFAQNAGVTGIATAVFGNVYNYSFGTNFDDHSRSAAFQPARPVGEGLICLEGRGCYFTTIYVALASCSVGLVLSGMATWRIWKRQKIVLE
ncbi:hypothetical protein OPQ81_002531 [Rhizoctonia solani]|nr:hypothetical protein OPQ81_002531 [Rhizoctonia solani]